MNNNNVLRMGDGTPNLLRTKRLNGKTETETVRFLNGKNGNGRIQIAH